MREAPAFFTAWASSIRRWDHFHLRRKVLSSCCSVLSCRAGEGASGRAAACSPHRMLHWDWCPGGEAAGGMSRVDEEILLPFQVSGGVRCWSY